MKKYIKEIVVLLIQIFSLYILPLHAMYISKDQTVITIFLNMIITFVLSIIFSKISKIKMKYLYPVLVAVLYIPSMYLFYKEFILIYLIFHLVMSFIGIYVGKLFTERK